MKENIKENAKRITSTARGGIEKVRKIKMIDEFKTFIARGNVLDLAVGVIIGGAFQSLVKSLTDNIISPILGCFSEVDFNSYTLEIGNLNLRYGAFITDIINFVIMAFIVFLIVKIMNKILVKKTEPKKEEVKVPEKPKDIELLEEIRDLLKENAYKDKK